ncbi:hypothetical protein LCGC14_0466430 [marine sediment metagenome]|uniref:Uncharacterized protein n=1 Tax=marine sediment metagenome TaxID=412755 RepID=A0A0F9VMF4_9ZZZZ
MTELDLTYEGEGPETIEVPVVEGPSAEDYHINVVTHEGKFNTEEVKFLVYAESGVGKTVFASTWPDPVFLDADRGMSSVSRNVGRIEIAKWADLENAIRYLLHSAHPYKTVVVDSLNEVQFFVMQNVISKFPDVRRPYKDLASQSDYGKALMDFDKYMRNLRALRMNVVFIANRAVQEYETDAIQPQFVGKNTARNVARMMDIVGYLYKADSGDKPKKSRIMAFDVANFVTKDRSDKLPSVVNNPTHNVLYEFWNKEK